MASIPLDKFLKTNKKTIDSLKSIRKRLDDVKPVHEVYDAPITVSVNQAKRLTGKLIERTGRGWDAPLIVALLGATGTGKSKIFNTIAGSWVSPSGYRRPTTMAPVLLTSSRNTELLKELFLNDYQKRVVNGSVEFSQHNEKEVIIVHDESESLSNLVLVDTPDFDSVLEANRNAAADVFERCDAVLFITDAVKYADQASWNYLSKIHERNKSAVIVVNRVKNPLSLQDFARRLNDFGLIRDVLSLSDEPDLSDMDLFKSENGAISGIRKRIQEWRDHDRADILEKEVLADWKELVDCFKNELIPSLDGAGVETRQLAEAARRFSIQARDKIAGRLTVAISGEMKNSLISQIQAQFLRWDILKRPRQIMALPFRFIKDNVLVPLGVMEKTGGPGGLEAEIDRLFEANCETLVSAVHEFSGRMEEAFSAGGVGRGMTGLEAYGTLSLSADSIREKYAEVRAELEKWVNEQAHELVKDLKLGEKVTFYLAQVVSLGLFVSIQVHTGGGFSFFDGLLDSALAPILSKITGRALSHDKVKAFEEEARRIHTEGCQGIIIQQEEQYLEFIASSEKGLASADFLKAEFEELKRTIGIMV